MLRVILCFFLALVPFNATAQDDTPNTTLVLDASGSMWGQIDGVNKIVIAREVIAEVMADLPATTDLGLMAYGHNRRGDCGDIELLIPPGPDTREAIVDAVNAINPRGRTPMSDAVVAAAQAMRHTENEATVILVSDGIETCTPDPCAIATELEQSGVGFTAHVIGFDVASEPEARAQMQCLAENTGGLFLTADTAEELAAALTQVAAPPPPEPARVTVRAIVAPNGTAPVSPLTWSLSDSDGGALLGPVAAPGFNVELPAGDYSVSVVRESQGTTHDAQFSATEGEAREVVLELPALLTPVTFEARLDTIDGPLITDPVLWNVAEVSDTAANPLRLDLAAGSYSVEAYWTAQEVSQEAQVSILGADPRTVVLIFETPLPSATLIAPERAAVGATIEVAWDGPNNANDFISVAEPGTRGNGINLTYTSEGSPLGLQMPPEPGTYEVRYVLAQGREVIASQVIEVTEVPVSLVAPETAGVGETVEVAWEGPDYANDFISVAEPGTAGNGINLTYTSQGSPLELQMPPEPGIYEIRYVLSQDREVLASRMIEVSEVAIGLVAPDTAIAGALVEVAWEGPDYANDFISVAEPGSRGNGINLTYTTEGSPLNLQMPTEPGTYEIRYVLSQDREVLASRKIEVTEVVARLVAPSTAIAGETVEVAWEGPDYDNDFIAVAEPGTRGNGINLTYTSQGSPLGLQMPPEAGSYELRYVLSQDREVIHSMMIEVTPVEATLSAKNEAAIGEPVTIEWTGPDYPNDFIAVGEPGSGGNGINRTFTTEGTPLEVAMPSEPGSYELRYVLSQDRVTVVSIPIEVSDLPDVTFALPGSLAAGTDVEIGHSGPGYPNDFIAFGVVGDDRKFEGRANAEAGETARIRVPRAPGVYEMRYYMSQDRRILGRQEVTVTAP